MKFYAKCMSSNIPNNNGHVFDPVSTKAAIDAFNAHDVVSVGGFSIPGIDPNLRYSSFKVIDLKWRETHAEIVIEPLQTDGGKTLDCLVTQGLAGINMAIRGFIVDDIVYVNSIDSSYTSDLQTVGEFNKLLICHCNTCGHNQHDICDQIEGYEVNTCGDGYVDWIPEK